MDLRLLPLAIVLSGLGLASVAVAAGDATEPQSPTGGSAAVEPGVWQEHKIELEYIGFTSHYSCDGLESKLELLLRQLGARPDSKVMTYGCDRGFGTPSRFPRATLKFATLKPAEAGAEAPAGTTTVAGRWRAVEIAPNRPFDLLDGDCELIEQFRDKVLPAFATRSQQLNIGCIPYQDNGPFDVRLQVFEPAPASASK